MVKQRLSHKFEFLDPMRRDCRGKEAESVDAIVRGDMADIESSRVILAYCPKPSVGTSMEIFYAYYVLGKPVFIVCEDDRPSPWLVKFSDNIFSGFDAAVERLNGWIR